MATKNAPTLITRTVKPKGRPSGPSKSTQDAYAALDAVFADKDRAVTLQDQDEAGNVIAEHVGPLVTPADVAKDATYTGLPALIGGWAKDRGHSVRAIAVDDGPNRLIETK